MSNIFKEALLAQFSAIIATQGESFVLIRNGTREEKEGVFVPFKEGTDDNKNGLRQTKEKLFVLTSEKILKTDIIERNGAQYSVINLPLSSDYSKPLDAFNLSFKTGLIKL